MQPIEDRKPTYCNAQCASQSEAYVVAGFSGSSAASVKANAARLMTRPEINARVQEILDAGARRAEIKAGDIIMMLLEDRNRAHENKQIGPAVRAAELLGRTFGMFLDKKYSIRSFLRCNGV
jgi:phage terminase small subunit